MLFGTSLRISEIGMAGQRHYRARFGSPHAPLSPICTHHGLGGQVQLAIPFCFSHETRLGLVPT